MSFGAVIEAMADGLSARVPRSENEYIGEDGFLHCSKCGRATQTQVQFLEKKKIVRCICDCKRAELEAAEQAAKREENERKRRICFSESKMYAWTFENDDRQNAKISDAMRRYADNFAEYRKNGQGLLLFGTVGTGKTYYAACIANRLLDAGTPVKMTNFARIANRIQAKFEGRQEYIDSLNRYSLLIIDDLGAERQSEYMQEIVFNIIDARYRSGLPLIVTTNLTAAELKSPQDVQYSRIYDRVLERCLPVEISGVSRRRQNLKANAADMRKQLGL